MESTAKKKESFHDGFCSLSVCVCASARARQRYRRTCVCGRQAEHICEPQDMFLFNDFFSSCCSFHFKLLLKREIFELRNGTMTRKNSYQRRRARNAPSLPMKLGIFLLVTHFALFISTRRNMSNTAKAKNENKKMEEKSKNGKA